MSNQLEYRSFETLEDLSNALQTALKQGRAIDLPKTNLEYSVQLASEESYSFCKNGNRIGLIREKLPYFDSVMVFSRGEGGLLLHEEKSKLENYSISAFYPFSNEFFNYDTEKQIISIGGKIILPFDNHNLLSLRSSIGSLEKKHFDSEEYAPRIGNLKPTSILDGLDFLAEEIYLLK